MVPNPTGFRAETPQEFAKRLNIPITDWLLLSRALTHRSYLNEHTEALEDNERLEFLGDAVLDFVVGAWLYNQYPEMPEGGSYPHAGCFSSHGTVGGIRPVGRAGKCSPSWSG